MRCPRCRRRGRKAFKGYCSKVHYQLDNPKIIRLTCASCGISVHRTPSRLSRGGRAFCSRCSKNQGESHPRWKEGQYLNPAGYRLILVKGAYKLEHRHTWEQANRACLLPEAAHIVAIHHINKIKTDNRPENLVLLTSRSHGRLHRLMDAGRYEEAKAILISNLQTQSFFLRNSNHVDRVRATKGSALFFEEDIND